METSCTSILCQSETMTGRLMTLESKTENVNEFFTTNISRLKESEKGNTIEISKKSKNDLISGIYSITNIINNKIYYGSSNFCKRRWRSHKSLLNRNKHENPHLQRSWNKHGEKSFIFDIVECVLPENLLVVEQKYL